MRYAAIAFGLVLSTLGAAPAFATTIAASTILADFNAVIFGSATTQADIEGAAVIGGSFSGATMYNNPNDGGTVTLPSGYNALTVYGSTSGNGMNIDNGGSAYVAGAHGQSISFNGGGGFSYTPPPNTITDFQTSLNSLSTQLSQLSANSSLVMPTDGSSNGVKFQATPGANGVSVFNITGSQLSSFASFVMNLNGSSSIIVNVSGTNITLNGNDNSGVTGANNIIWNFYQATTLNIGTLLGGTVLATQAAVTNNNQIDGGLFAASWAGNGELHSYSFTGTLPGSGTVVATPEPASLALLGAGLSALGFVRRRRAKRG
ncbi:MAG TPA: collagen-binding domain-containing protein [Alphaproteobacteria bacterium]|jgi:choice-of-anchor A domain-containing protein|nr:collagen-binding domain-containing protein [Alphaproteobacteria bacterium]